MNSSTRRILFITEDFPSGLNGTSVKTRNTLSYLLKQGFIVDVCCFHFEDFKVHDFKHANVKIYSVETKRFNKKSLEFLIHVFLILFSIAPITIKRLFSLELQKKIIALKQKKKYDLEIYDGYSTLQYLQQTQTKKIYIDDEDFTDLFMQRFFKEQHFFKKLFYFYEYLKSLIFERVHMSRVSQIWAISERTKQRLQKVTGLKTVVMPTFIPLEKNLYSGAKNQIVFTGTLNWRENVEGLKWFVREHWMYIQQKFPAAKLVVIGQGASEELVHFLNTYKNIEYKGYVESLVSEYKKSTLSIAPVRINAGIKVKILTYMSYGLPVVSTHIASWGLVSTNGIMVSDDRNFGKEVVRLLKNQKLCVKLSQLAHTNIKDNHSMKVLHKFFLENLDL